MNYGLIEMYAATWSRTTGERGKISLGRYMDQREEIKRRTGPEHKDNLLSNYLQKGVDLLDM